MLVVNFKFLPLHVNIFRSPDSTADCIKALQKSVGITIPHCMEEWIGVPRTEMDIRHSMVVEDGIRAACKRRFDPSKLIKVILWLYTF